MATVDACLSLINSKVTEQRARGVALLERGEFQTPDSVKHIDALLAALNHPLTEANIAIRQNVLRVLPALLQRCGGSLRSSLDRVLPHLAERLVDNDPQSRAFAARALHELFANTRAPAAIGALLAPTVLTRGVRVREMVFIFLCDVLHLTRGSVHADDRTLARTLNLTLTLALNLTLALTLALTLTLTLTRCTRTSSPRRRPRPSRSLHCSRASTTSPHRWASHLGLGLGSRASTT